LDEFALAGFDLPRNSSWLTAMVGYAEAAIATRSPGHAEALFDRLVPWADQWSSVGASAEGPVSRVLGGLASTLGRYDEAESYFRRSAVMSNRMGSKFFAAWTDLMWGEMLAERQEPGYVEEVRRLVARAHAVSTVNGYGNVERRASAALRLLDS
jgi:ATP/maltotriose-dependent transcriptional regulator MalT